MRTEYIVNSDTSFAELLSMFTHLWLTKRYMKVTIDTGRQRTKKQNSAIHAFFAILAKVLNDAGLDQRVVLKPEIEIPWEEKAVKEKLWKPVQHAVIGKESTAKAERQEYGQVYDVFMYHMSSKFGVYVPWPEELKDAEVA
jgi:hypothetical protein